MEKQKELQINQQVAETETETEVEAESWEQEQIFNEEASNEEIDKYNILLIKPKDTMNMIKKIGEKGVSKNVATEWNGLIKELQEIKLQLELQLRIQGQQKC